MVNDITNIKISIMQLTMLRRFVAGPNERAQRVERAEVHVGDTSNARADLIWSRNISPSGSLGCSARYALTLYKILRNSKDDLAVTNVLRSSANGPPDASPPVAEGVSEGPGMVPVAVSGAAS